MLYFCLDIKAQKNQDLCGNYLVKRPPLRKERSFYILRDGNFRNGRKLLK